MKIQNRRGPKNDPYGTAVWISHQALFDEPIFVVWFVLVR